MSQLIHFQRSYDSTRSFAETCDEYLSNPDIPPDVEFICMDGKVLAHQFMLSPNSELLRSIFNRFQLCEFHKTDWDTGQILLYDRHKGFEFLSISVPDVSTRHVEMMISCFYRGTINLGSAVDDSRILKEIWDLFKIDTLKIGELEPFFRPIAPANTILIKSEPDDECLDIKPDLETLETIPLECHVCNEQFVLEEHLSSHMDDKHKELLAMLDEDTGTDAPAGNEIEKEATTNEIEKEATLNETEMKSELDESKKTKKKSKKGKGKGKKSVQQEQPLRKTDNNIMTEQESPRDAEQETPRDAQQEDNQSEKAPEEQKEKLEEEKPESETEKVTEKRPASDTDDPTSEPPPKRVKPQSESSSSDKTPPPEEVVKTWDDIACIICQQPIAIWMRRPGDNRRRYQQHLLKHFMDSQYNEIKEGLRIYQCSYKECSYAGGDKNPYIQHIAFKHDEWFKRINKQLEEAPGPTNNLEELKVIKEFFTSDYRVITVVKNKTQNTKPLWVEGTAIGKEEEKQELKPDPPINTVTNQNEMEIDDEIEKSTMDTSETPEKNKKLLKCIHCDEHFPILKDLHKHMKENHDPPAPKIPKDVWKVAKGKHNIMSPKNSRPNSPKCLLMGSLKEHNGKNEKSQTVEAKNEETPKLSSEETNSPNSKSDNSISDKGSSDKSKKSGDVKKKLECVYCNKVLPLIDNPSKNKQAYQAHLMQHHFEKDLFKDIPERAKYYCPYKNCDFDGADFKIRFILHLGFRHREFSKRINRRVKELQEDAKSFDDHMEYSRLKDLKTFFQSDPRLIDISQPKPGDTWSEDCDVVSPESITKATAPGSTISPSPKPPLQVELSKDWLEELKAEPIKQEPGQPMEDDSLPLITLSSTPVSNNPTETMTPVIEKPTKTMTPVIEKPTKNMTPVIEKPTKNVTPVVEKSTKTLTPVVENTTNMIPPLVENSIKTSSVESVGEVSGTSDQDEIKQTKINKERIEKLPETDEPAKIAEKEKSEETLESLKGTLENLLKTSKLAKEEPISPVKQSKLTKEEPISPVKPSKSTKEEPISPVKPSADLSEAQMDLPAMTETAGESVSSPTKAPSLRFSDHSNGSREYANDVYSCKKCDQVFHNRQLATKHVIETHNFHHIQHLVDETYSCHYENCNVTKPKRYPLLVHLMTKHKEVEFGQVTLDINFPPSDPLSSLAQTPSVKSSKEDSQEEELKIKEELIIQETPVEISGKDETHIVWNCKQCKKSFESEDLIRQHVLIKHLIDQFDRPDLAPPGLPIYACKKCLSRTYSTNNRFSFIKHLGMVHQVVSSEEVENFIEQETKLLLDIDIIKCRCRRTFDTEKQLREHIIFGHYKVYFKSIPKQLESYPCDEPKCHYNAKSRTIFIKHKVTVHKALTEKQIEKFIPANDAESSSSSSSSDSSSEDEPEPSPMDLNDALDSISNAPTEPSTYYNDDVSIIEDEGSIHSRMSGDISFSNNRCPVCSKHIPLRSNFEDHLQTHGIKQQVVLSCVDCGFASSFAKLYYHINTHHSESTSITISCLACEDVMLADKSVSAVVKLKEHCLGTNPGKNARKTPNKHKSKAHLYNNSATNDIQMIYSNFRYSCQNCNFYFKTWEDLKNHGTKFNSDCHQMANGARDRMDPVYKCHLCNFNKAASIFENHFKGNLHQEKVKIESKKDKAKYGLESNDYFYECEPCRIATSYSNLVEHFKLGNTTCKSAYCLPCGQQIETVNAHPMELAKYFENQHLLTDQHTEGVYTFKANKEGTSRWARFKYLCITCSTCFIDKSNLFNHNNCNKIIFRCMSCDHTCSSGEFALHISTSLHKQIQTRKSLRRRSSQNSQEVRTSGPGLIHDIDDEDNILHIDEEDNVPQSDIVEILDDSPENSPPHQPIRPSLTISRAKPSIPSQRMNYQSPARSPQVANSFPRPPSPADSIMEIEVRHNPPTFSIPSNLQVHQLPSSRLRPPSPADSVMEVQDSRPVSPSPSIMELDRDTIMQLPVTPSRKIRQSAFTSPSQMRPSLPVDPNLQYSYLNSRAGPSTQQWVVGSQQRVVGSPPIRGRSPKNNHSPRPSTSTVQRSNGLPTPFLVGNVTLQKGTGRPIPMGNRKQQGVRPPLSNPSSNIRNQFECKEPCKMTFKTPSAFKDHAEWHDKTNSPAIMECHFCEWKTEDRMVGQKVRSHLADSRHTLNVAKKMYSRK